MKNKKVLITLTLAVIVAALNVYMGIHGNNMLANVHLRYLEALASDEFEQPGGDGEIVKPSLKGKLYPNKCDVYKMVITGHKPNGEPIWELDVVDGEEGICAGDVGPCVPYKCAELKTKG